MEARAEDMRDRMGKHDPLGDVITVFLVLVTLFGAAVALRQANAHFEHDEATVRAEEWAVLASSQRTRANQAEQLQLGRRRLARHDSMNAREAIGQSIFGRGNDAMLELEARQWQERARRTTLESRRLAHQSAVETGEIQAAGADAFPGIDPDLGKTAPCVAGLETPAPEAVGMGPSRGPPTSTDSYTTDLRREAFRMEGRRAAATATAVKAEEQFTRYAASLALIAVALFFLGYALTKYGHRFRKIFVFFAALLTGLSVFFFVSATLDSPPKPEPAAAAAYADGKVAFESGHFQTALEDFACATHLNPHFEEAYLQQSEAFDLRGMPRDALIVNESLENRSNLRKALDYGRRARQLNPEDPQALTQIATALFVYGVSDRNRAQLTRALALDRRQRADMPDDPIPAFNTATTLLALGRPWRKSYGRAERLMSESSQPLAYVGAALTDLDFLRASHLRNGLAAEAKEAKEQVVAAGMADAPGHPRSGSPGPDGRALASDVRLQMTPAAAYLGFEAKGLRADRDQVFLAVYHRERLGWQEVQPLSGRVVPERTRGGYEAVLWTSSPTSCLPGGKYKVELYVDGRIANVVPESGATAHLPRLVRRSLRGMNLYLCEPGKAWRRIPRHAAGLLDGFEHRAPKGREGVVVFDLSASTPRDFRRAVPTLLRHFSPPLPRGAQAFKHLPGPVPLGNLPNARLTSFVYPHGEMLVATAATPIGRRLAIAVFGPPVLFAGHGPTHSLGVSLLESLITYD
jgi:tetratricopeptide (TPR) repeat protein